MAWVVPDTYTVGQLLTAASMNKITGDLLLVQRELDYAQITSNTAAITATTEGTAVAVITGNSVAYDGSRVKVEFFAGETTSNGGNSGNATFVFLRDATVIGQFLNPSSLSNSAGLTHAYGATFDTPSAASHTYKVSAFVSANALVVAAGSGVSGALVPAFLRVTNAKT